MPLYTDEDVGIAGASAAPEGPGTAELTDEQVGVPPSEPSWFEKQKSSPKSMGAAFMRGLEAGVGAVIQGLGATGELGGGVTGAGALSNIVKMAAGKPIEVVPPLFTHTPAETVQGVAQNPIAQAGEAVVADAVARWQPEKRHEQALLTKGAEMAGGFLPVIAAGPAAPGVIALQSFGSHLTNDFNEGLSKGLDPETAARNAILKATASGATQGTIFAALPPPLRGVIDKYFIDKLGVEGAKRFLAGRAANVIEGFALGTASVAGENIVSGQPVTKDIVAGGAGMAAPMAFFPRGKTRWEVQRAPLQAQRRTLLQGFYDEENHPPPPEVPPVIFRPPPEAPPVIAPPIIQPEKGAENAPTNVRIEPVSREPEYSGISPGENVPAYTPEIRQETRPSPSGGGGDVEGRLVAPEAPKGEPEGVRPVLTEKEIRALPTVEAVRLATVIVGKEGLRQRIQAKIEWYKAKEIEYPFDTPEGIAGLTEQTSRDILREFIKPVAAEPTSTPEPPPSKPTLPPPPVAPIVSPAGPAASQPLTVRTATGGTGEASLPRSNEAQTGAGMTVGGVVPRSAAELAALLKKAKAVEDNVRAQYQLKKDSGNRTVKEQLRLKVRNANLQVQQLRNELDFAKRAEQGPKTVTVRVERTADAGGERPPDIIDDFRGVIGKKLSLESAKQFIEDIEQRLKAYPVLRKIFTRQGGLAMDNALDSLHREGRHLGITTETDFLEALIAAAANRKGAKGKAAEKAKGESAAEAKTNDFEEAALQPRANSEKDGIPVSTLYVGDKFKLRDVECEVSDLIIDQETGEVAYVEVKDGRRFGTQRLANTEESFIFPDKGTFEKKEVKPEDVWNVEEKPAPPPPAAPEAPTPAAPPAEQPPVAGVRPPAGNRPAEADLFGEPVSEAKAPAPVTPELPIVQPQVKGLNKAEQVEFEALSLKIRAAREKNGEQLTSEEARRYDELNAKAGQIDLFAAPAPQEGIVARLAQLRAKREEIWRQRDLAVKNYQNAKIGSKFAEDISKWTKAIDEVQRQIKALEAQAQELPVQPPKPPPPPKVEAPPVLPVDTRTPQQIFNKAKWVTFDKKWKQESGALFIRGYDAKGRWDEASIANLEKQGREGWNPFINANLVRFEAGVKSGKKGEWVPIKGDIVVKERKPKESELPEYAENYAEPDRLIAEAKGPQDFLKLLERPELQIPEPEKALLREFFNRPTIQKLTGLRLAIVEAIKSGFVGDYDPQSRLSRFIAAESGIHETLHDLWYFLSPADRMEYVQLRQREIAAALKDLPRNYKEIAALERLAKEPMSSEEFIKENLPRGLYYLANEREFFVASNQHRFLLDVLTPEAKGLVAKTKAIIQEVWNWLKTAVGAGDRRDALYRKILKGDYELSPEEGARLEGKEIEGALPRTPEEYRKQKAFEEKNVAGRTLAAYSDIAKFKMEQADLLGLSPAARRMIHLPRESEMYSMAASELRGIENYYQARDAVPADSPHLRWGVIGDALHSLAFEEELARKITSKFEAQQALVDSPSFQKKIAREAELAMRENVATAKEDTFRNVIAQKVAVLEAQLRRDTTESARTATLREDLRLARGLLDYTMAIAQQMDNIVNRVYREFTAFGRPGYWTRWRENATGPKNGEEFLRLYLSARRAEGNPLENGQELALARLAAEILGINYDLTNRLLWAERWRREPDFQQAVKDLGATFVKRLREDPAAAIRWMVQREGKLATKAEQAKAAYLAINRDVMRELERLGDYEQAASALNRIRGSDPWKQLVNTVYADAEALHLPDVVVKAIKDGKYNTVFNEFTGRMVKVDPKGEWHEVDLEWTPQNAEKSQAKLDTYLGAIDDWLNDPANEAHPDFQYWQDQHDWIHATYKTASVFAPRNVKSLLIHTALKMPEFWFKQAKLPAAKVAQTAAENWERSFDSGKQWSQGVEQPIIRLAQIAARKHWVDVSLGLQAYREQVFNSIAWAYRHGIAIKPGDKLYGVTVLMEDINLLKSMGRAINDLITRTKNLGRERVMEPERLVDDYFKNAFLIRRPQEFGAEKGTTVPREFSSRAKMLARRIVGETIAPDGTRIAKPLPLDKAMEVFNWEGYFEPFVMRWLAERSADYSKETPFEGLFKDIVKLHNEKSPDAPRTVEEIIDYIDRNTDEATTRDSIKEIVVGGMVNELASFYNRFLKDDGAKALTIRVLRATSQGPFNKAFEHDIGSSFYYDYGMLSGQEVRSMALDAGMYHLERFEIALHDLERVYNKAMLEFDETKGNPAARALLKQRNKALFASGDDFRDFSVLRDQRAELRYFLENLPIWTGRGVAQYEGMQTMYRLVGDSVLSTLAGWKTLARVLSGSVVKQGFVFGAFERFYYTAYLKAALSMAMSAFQIGVKGPLMFAARRIGLAPKLDEQFSGWAEEIFRTGKYFDQQYAYGLGTKTPVLDTIYNNLVMPYTHGRGYDPRLSGNAGLRLLQKGAYKVLSAFEAPLEVIKTIFPTMGYSIAYDSVARQMYWAIKSLEAQARRSFEAHEQAGTLGRFDLNNPRSLKNLLPAEEILPRGFFKRTQTQLDLVGEYFKRGTDADINDFVMEFWKKLSETPKEQRGNVHLLSSDARTPEEAQTVERNRAGALAAIGLFDIHHASPMNRMWSLRASTVGRLAFPIAGWTLQSTRQWFALFGRAAHDPQMRAELLTAMTVLTILAGMSAMAVGGDTEKRLFEKLEWIINRKVDPVRHFGQGRTAKENAIIALHDVIAYVTVMANLFDQILGEKGNRVSAVDQIYVYAKLKSLAQYVGGVIHSKDPNYGLSSFVVREAPSLKPLLNRLPSNEGIVAQSNVRTAIQRYAPEELLRKEQGGAGLPTPTELSPIKQRLLNAIYKGDSEGVATEYENLKAKAIEVGRTEPLRLAADIVRSLNPYTLALIGHPTEAQRSEMLSKLNDHERQIVLDGESMYLAATQLVGVQSQMTREQRGSAGAGHIVGIPPSTGVAAGGSAVPVGTAGGGGGPSLLGGSAGGGGMGMPRRISLGIGAPRMGLRRIARISGVSSRIRTSGLRKAKKRFTYGRLKVRSGRLQGKHAGLRTVLAVMPRRHVSLHA